MAGTTAGRASVQRVGAAVGAAVLAGLGVVSTDVPPSVVAQSTVAHLPTTPAALVAATTSPAAAGVRVTTGVAEAGTTSPTHVSRSLPGGTGTTARTP